MRKALHRRISFLTLAAAALWLTAWFAPVGAHAAGDEAKAAALQACPAVEEEIVDLELLAEGLNNCRAVGLLEKLRPRSAIDDLIG
jgi:aryl carrier-like protein